MGKSLRWNNVGVNSSSPVTMNLTQLGPTEAVSDIGLGEDQGCLLTNLGAVYCWGDDSYGQLADGATGGAAVGKPQPSLITTGALELTVGRYHAGVRTSAGFQVWGLNTFGQLGQGTTTNSATPLTAIF